MCWHASMSDKIVIKNGDSIHGMKTAEGTLMLRSYYKAGRLNLLINRSFSLSFLPGEQSNFFEMRPTRPIWLSY